MVIHLEPDTLECEVKWAMGSITTNKARGGDRISAELFLILKDGAVKVLHSIYLQIGNSAVATGVEKVSFHSDPKERQCKECSNYHIIALISSKIMLKILQARFQQYVNRELPHAQTGFRKGRGARDQAANISWIIEKAKKFQITSTSASLTTLKPLTVWITKNCRIFLKRWEYQITLPVS